MSKKFENEKEMIGSRGSSRKLQVANGYYLEFPHLSRVLSYIFEQQNDGRISRGELEEATGLPDRHVEALVSMGRAMGFIEPRRHMLTVVGELVANYDIFFEKTGTIEWCHYVGATSYANLVWYEVFHSIFKKEPPLTQIEWRKWLYDELEGKYEPCTVEKASRQEIKFLVDAYTNQELSRLKLLEVLPDDAIILRRYIDVNLLIFTAALYDFYSKNKSTLYEIGKLATACGSPALVFGMDEAFLKGLLENLHNKGWIRYESTHNLNQVRLKHEFSPLQFLAAHYGHRPLLEMPKLIEGDLR